VIECASCHTLNPDSETSCLMCGLALAGGLRAAPATLRCPAGHPIDPSWRTCPYCDRLRAAGEPAGRATRLEGTSEGPAAGPFAPTVVQATAPAAPRATRLEAVPTAPRRTVLADGPPAAERAGAPVPGPGASGPAPNPPGAAPAPVPAPARRLVGVLAAPGLGPGGAVFAVRQGKNVIGSDRASDVCLGADPKVSAEHALLLHRGDAFYLADRMSTNGTWVNDAEVPANGTVVLHDRDRIRCGGVELIFLQVEPAAGTAAH